MEVLPRSNRVNLLLAIDFNEVANEHAIARDSAERAFFVNAQHEGGVYIPIRSEDDIEKAMPVVRQAHALASA